MRPITVIFNGSGWGAGDMRTADGPGYLLSRNLINNVISPIQTNVEVFYSYWHHETPVEDSQTLDPKIRYQGCLDNCRWLSYTVENAIRKNRFPIIFGGDHAQAMGTWNGVRNAGKENVHIAWIDAHMDAHTYETSPSNNPHGMPVAALMGYGDKAYINLSNNPPAYSHKQFHQYGIRDYEIGEAELLKRLQVNVNFCKKNNIFKLSEKLKEFRKAHAQYGISFDIDGLDPKHMPGTGTPVENGLDFNDSSESIKSIYYDRKCIAFELVEFNPHKDIGELTFNNVLKIVSSIFEKA